MQAILVADYSFTPLEYWRGVSQTARDFIRRCLDIDSQTRMTAYEALQHPWISAPQALKDGEDLLPTVKKNFNARRTLHAAIDTIRAINQLRAGGGAALMDGLKSKDPEKAKEEAARVQKQAQPVEESVDQNNGVIPMEIDSRGDARGQTEEMIREQERRIRETTANIWGRR
jgi:calcium/calmodulin-dependent protein kinase I